MTKPEAVQLLRSLLNAPAIKLLLSTMDIAKAEQALEALADEKHPTP